MGESRDGARGASISRRKLLTATGLGIAGASAGALLNACGPAGTGAGAPAATAGGTSAPATPRPIEKVGFMTSFRVSSIDSPVYLARERGYFRDVGLEVEIAEGSGSANTAKVVGAGQMVFGYADGGTVIRSVAEGIPVTAISCTTQTSPIAVIVKRSSGITKPQDLVGKKIGGAQGGAGELLLPGWLRKNGVNPDQVTVVLVAAAARNALLLDGQVDGVPGFINGDFIIFKSRGLDPYAVRYADFGFNIPGTSLIVNNSFLRSKPDVVKAFNAAYLKAVADSVKDPAASIDAMVKAGPSTLVKQVEMDAYAEALKLLRSARTQTRPIGWMAREDWEEAGDILVQYGGLSSKPKMETVLTNDYIPA